LIDCTGPTVVEKEGFFKRLKAKSAQGRMPLAGSMEVTMRCNLRCVHCYLGDFRSGIPELRELSLAEIFHIIDQITDAGCLDFLLTGGEPFVRPDLLEIYDYARSKGLLVSIFTNGTLLTPTIADHLAGLPPYSMEITLYGATEVTYERVTGIPGSFERCLRGIDLLLERGIRLKLKTMLLTLNQHELEAMREFSADRGVEFRYDPLLTGAHDGSVAPQTLRIAPEQVIEAELQDPVRSRKMKDFLQRFADLKMDDRYLYTCGAGLHSFHIDPYGRLSPCITSRARTYDLRQGTFKEGWEQFLPQERALPATKTTRCSSCSLHAVCDQCVGWAYTENGDPQEPVDYLCQIAHLRAQAFKI
jgi:radical SAM protein with 4Fe4S-binding SPASM domain